MSSNRKYVVAGENPPLPDVDGFPPPNPGTRLRVDRENGALELLQLGAGPTVTQGNGGTHLIDRL